jgi:dTDP-3-amino-3,6-dideoxy-alpha-D-glucopyranose N,N-dimethyltransferase/dTDP-3-amino-3,4,6-trideoxy-alpha-D-glucopyranose N,N-dimethyltransferase
MAHFRQVFPTVERMTQSTDQPFSGMARYYDAIYRAKGKNYRAEAEYLHGVIQRHRPGSRSLLDAACGTAEHLLHLSEHYDVAGFDLSRPMLDVARAKLPRARFHVADLTLPPVAGRFDVVTCLFAAIAYLPDRPTLSTAVTALAGLLNPGGLLLIEPGVMPDKVAPPTTSTLTATIDGVMIQRTTSAELLREHRNPTAAPSAIRITFDHAVRSSDPSVAPTRFTERHTLQLFTRHDYQNAIAGAGLRCDFDPAGPAGMGLLIATR